MCRKIKDMSTSTIDYDEQQKLLFQLVFHSFPEKIKTRKSLRNHIESCDQSTSQKIENCFTNVSWDEINFQNLYNIFFEDLAAAFYLIPKSEKLLLLPAVLIYIIKSDKYISGCDYLLENILFGSEIERLDGIAEQLNRNQLAVSLAILAYDSVNKWELPSPKKLKKIRNIVENGDANYDSF
jgi:hypothetical protein